ncbi:MAG: hypothetical protein ABEJ66_03040, partial [Candidatus Nanohaloarchaea archaeon]
RSKQLDNAVEAEKQAEQQGGDAEDEKRELESEIKSLEDKQYEGHESVEDKLSMDDNPVKELQERLRDEERKVDRIRGSDPDENPFEA